MTSEDFIWTEESLDDYDRRLISAYAQVGRPVDDLAYTQDFDEVVRIADQLNDVAEVTDEKRHDAYRRLLNLRKRGRLPRLVHSSSASSSASGA